MLAGLRLVTDSNGASMLDWQAWHEDYEHDSPLRRRLEIVQRHIGDFLGSSPASPVRVLTMCAGEGRDILGAIAEQKRRDVTGLLVELDPALAARARSTAEALGLKGVRVEVGDAGRSGVYASAAPADLVMACGVFGNISDDDVRTTIRALPELAAPGATLIWTRHRGPPDLTPSIRAWLAEAEFREISFESVPEAPGSVGVAQFVGRTKQLMDRQLFVFNRAAL
jgi:hypothetical protein